MRTLYLLDVNVLLALFWEAHTFAGVAREWFKAKGRRGWATCPITAAGFVRITSNPAFSRDTATPHDSISLLSENMKDAAHTFWPDAISLADAVSFCGGQLKRYQQITDAYLLGLAIHNNGKLATFDRGISGLLPAGSPHLRAIELVGA